MLPATGAAQREKLERHNRRRRRVRTEGKPPKVASARFPPSAGKEKIPQFAPRRKKP